MDGQTRLPNEASAPLFKEILKRLNELQALPFLSGDEILLTEEQAADEMKMKKQTLAVWRTKGVGPEYIKFGSSVRYQLGALRRHIQQQTVSR